MSKGSIDKVDNNDNQKDDWEDMNRPAKMIKVLYQKSFEPVREKTNNLGSVQVRHKSGCTVTEDG